ncbi:UrcA family protein [Congregibacter variabilis]|uniref:UrcA family protein n=1 Tax=Congregibacter variabilis TaxID=3081200 RepID=A0ABZ0I3R3_9GAMM|nr:UrcA family protein [Congregibacter sp. IMCC43200]
MKALGKVTIATAISGFLAVAALPASAESTTKVVADSIAAPTQVTVNFSDLDLDSSAGQVALQYRLAHAAEQACGYSDIRRAGGVAQAARNAECSEQSLSRALSRVTSSAVASTD